MSHHSAPCHRRLTQLIAMAMTLFLLAACGGTPKDVDREGLRDRADQETSQVK